MRTLRQFMSMKRDTCLNTSTGGCLAIIKRVALQRPGPLSLPLVAKELSKSECLFRRLIRRITLWPELNALAGTSGRAKKSSERNHLLELDALPPSILDDRSGRIVKVPRMRPKRAIVIKTSTLFRESLQRTQLIFKTISCCVHQEIS